MAENYKLVSEDEWQAMVDRAEVAEGWSEHWKFEAEDLKQRLDGAEHRLATLLEQRVVREEPVEWADRAKTATVSRYDTDGRLIYHGPVDSAPAFGEFTTNLSDNTDRFEYVTENGVRTPIERPRKVEWYEQDEPRPLPPYMGPAPCEHLGVDSTSPQTTVSSTSESAPNFVYAFPQRPHESLVWAIYHAAAMVANFVVNKVDLHPHHAAEKAMGTWRARWPESE